MLNWWQSVCGTHGDSCMHGCMHMYSYAHMGAHQDRLVARPLVRAQAHGPVPIKSGAWSVASGKWQVASGKWQVVSGEWQVVSGKW